MKFKRTLAATKTEAIVAVIEGLAVEQTGYFMTEEQLEGIEASLEAAETAVAAQETSAAALTAAQEATQTAEAALATATQTIATKDASIAALQAQVATLNASAAAFQETNREKDEQGGNNETPFHASDSNPANQIADQLFGKPKA